jgi:endoglucanase Acf2
MTWDSIGHAYLQVIELDVPFGWPHFLSNQRKNKPNYLAIVVQGKMNAILTKAFRMKLNNPLPGIQTNFAAI